MSALPPIADIVRCGERRRYSITSSAPASSDCGTVSPSAFAVLRLMTSSYLVGAWTGNSAGFSPLRTRSTYAAARRNSSIWSDPYEIRPPAATKKAFPVDGRQPISSRKLDDQIAMNDRRSVRCNDQSATRRSREGGDGALDLCGVAKIEG